MKERDKSERPERAVAYLVRIKEILEGNYMVVDAPFSPNYVLTKEGIPVSRAHILATVVNTYSSNDGKYAFISIDDGSGVIRVKAFQDTRALSKIKRGDIVDVVGKIREYNKERYLVPELIRVVTDPNEEILRKLQIMRFYDAWAKKKSAVLSVAATTEKIDGSSGSVAGVPVDDAAAILKAKQLKENKEEDKIQAKDNSSVRALILKIIGEIDKGEGATYNEIITASGLPVSVIENGLNELLSEGSCYEPRPGKIKII